MSDTFATGLKADLTGKVAVITGAARDIGRYVPLNCLPPEEVAEQIFAAVDARSFWFRAPLRQTLLI